METLILILSIAVICLAIGFVVGIEGLHRKIKDIEFDCIRAQKRCDIEYNELMAIKHDVEKTHCEFAERLEALENALDGSGIDNINKAFNDEFEKLMSYNVSAAYRAKE